VKPTTREFPTAVVLSLSSGRMLCAFGEMHEFAEFLAGTSIWTHQLAHRPFMDELKDAIFKQHPELRDFDADSVTTENWKAIVKAAVKRFGKVLKVHPMGEPERYEAAMAEPLAGKRVLVVDGE
jgi:hypothetical protein